MGEDIDGRPALLLGMGADDPDPMLADLAVRLDILVANLRGAGEGRRHALVTRLVAHGLLHLIERPTEIDGRGAGGGERVAGAIEPLIRGVGAERKRDPVSDGCTDQRRAPHLHGGDGPRGVVERAERHGLERMRQLGLVDDFDRFAVGVRPDGAIGLAADLHAQSPANDIKA